jgi:O6-methylguanine-DNA--protein-cysteine methyltransferase
MAIGRSTPGTHLSPGQASYVLERLLRERRVSMGEVNGYLSDMNSEIEELEQRLQRLRDAKGDSGGAQPAQSSGESTTAPARRRRGRPRAAASAQGDASQGGAKAGGAKSRRKKRGAVTAEQMASRQLQGRYLALVRQFPAGRRPIYAKIARDRGREAAIKAMQDAVGKR